MVFYQNRYQAGEILANKFSNLARRDILVLGIARGGVITASPIAKKLKAPLDVIVVRKLPIPYNIEAGFGAVAPDGELTLNREYVLDLGFSQEQIKKIAQPVLGEIKRRIRVYRGRKKMPEIKGKIVIVADDGLATGYTMISALKYLRGFSPQKLICAVPVSSPTAFEEVKNYADEMICDHISEEGPFAVASFYQEFPDLKDEEVVKYLKECFEDVVYLR